MYTHIYIYNIYIYIYSIISQGFLLSKKCSMCGAKKLNEVER